MFADFLKWLSAMILSCFEEGGMKMEQYMFMKFMENFFFFLIVNDVSHFII